MLDVIIIGAGPAGLSAALILGRCCRQVQVFDTGVYRNAASSAMHGFLTRDGILPLEFLQTARAQLARYDTVTIRQLEVVDVQIIEQGFEVILHDASVLQCRKLLIATGVVDNLPPIQNFRDFYGKSVFHCPYCDGWEFRGRPIAIYGKGEYGKGLALELTRWSKDLVFCTDGPSGLDEYDLTRLASHAIAVREDPIEYLAGDDGLLQRIVFANGGSIRCDALFFNAGEHPASMLATKLGCTFDAHGRVATGKYEVTNIAGLYVAGDASRAVQLVIVAAAEGAEAAFSINTVLLKEDLAETMPV